MRTMLLCMTMLTAGSAEAQTQVFDHDLTLTVGLSVAGFLPGVAIRPEGGVMVQDIPRAQRLTRGILSSKFWILRSETELFMADTWGMDGPVVVGLNFRTLAEPYSCSSQKGFMMDFPWRNPCVAVGYAYRGSYNTYDYTYGRGTFAHGIQAHMRIFSMHEKKTFMWFWGEWIPSGLDPAFTVTSTTRIPAKDLETQLFRLGTTSGTVIGDNGQLTSEALAIFSKEGLASMRYLIRYLHRFDFGLLGDGDGEKSILHEFTLLIGIEVESGVNFRKVGRMGRFAHNFRILLGMPIGGD